VSDRGKWLYGRAIENGVPRFLSVSRLSSADPRENGCLRSWWYAMVAGRKKPSTRASKRGDDLHLEIETYLKTGNRSLSSLALGGMHMVPERGPDLLIEHDLLRRPRDPAPEDGLDLSRPDQLEIATARANALLAAAPLTAAGIPVLGRMDLVHGRGTNKGVPNIEETLDPPNTVEVLDWKSTGSPQYIKRPKDLPNLIQMAGYAEWVFRVEPSAEQVRLSHAYFVERGGPSRKVSLRVVRDDVAPTWEHAESVARSIRDAARETDPDRVDANTNACDAYGGCFHKEICKARMHVSLASFIGQQAASDLINNKGKETPKMGLLDKLQGKTTATTSITNTPAGGGLAGLIAGAAPATATTTAPAPTPPPAPDLAAARAQLEAEEARLRAEAQHRAVVDKITPLANMFAAYGAANPIGTPSYAGEAAAAVATALGLELVDGTIAGAGALAKITIATVADAEDLARQLEEAAAAGQVQRPAASAITQASSPLIASLTAAAQATTVPSSDPAPAAPTDATDEPAKKKRGRPPKAATAPAESATDEPAKVVETPPPPPAQAAASGAFSLFVDAVVEVAGAAVQSFHPILDALCAELAAQSNDVDLRAAGLRGAAGGLVFDKDSSPLAFGRAEGALAALLRERDIAPGCYYLDTRGNRLAEVAADALRDKCRKTGGTFVWGRR